MSFSKTLYSAPDGIGSVVVSESAGVVNLGVGLSAVAVMDLGLSLLAAKFPSLAAEIALIKAALDAEAAKI